MDCWVGAGINVVAPIPITMKPPGERAGKLWRIMAIFFMIVSLLAIVPTTRHWIRNKLPKQVSINLSIGSDSKATKAPPLTSPRLDATALACDLGSNFDSVNVNLKGIDPFIFGKSFDRIRADSGGKLNCQGPVPLVGCAIAAVQGIPSGMRFVLRDGVLVRIEISSPTITSLAEVHMGMTQAEALTKLGVEAAKGIDFVVEAPVTSSAIPSQQTIRVMGKQSFDGLGMLLTTDGSSITSQRIGLVGDVFEGAAC